jgi:cytoskeletal protein CcmA (bactofilin family)
MAILNKKDDFAEPGRVGAPNVHTILGRGSEFDGKLTFEGEVRIEGKFNGEIFTNDVLVVGEGSTVHAEIQAGTVIVNGEVVGNIKARSAVELHHPARVKGNIATPSIIVDKGVIFEGNCKMENLEKDPAVVTPVTALHSPEKKKA